MRPCFSLSWLLTGLRLWIPKSKGWLRRLLICIWFVCNHLWIRVMLPCAVISSKFKSKHLLFFLTWVQEYLVPNRLQKGGLDLVGAVSLLKFWYATVFFFFLMQSAKFLVIMCLWLCFKWIHLLVYLGVFDSCLPNSPAFSFNRVWQLLYFLLKFIVQYCLGVKYPFLSLRRLGFTIRISN